MKPTNTHATYGDSASDLAMDLDLAMAHDDMARWDYLFTTGTPWSNLATEDQHAAYAARKAEIARQGRIARAMVEGAATGVLPV